MVWLPVFGIFNITLPWQNSAYVLRLLETNDQAGCHDLSQLVILMAVSTVLYWILGKPSTEINELKYTKESNNKMGQALHQM